MSTAQPLSNPNKRLYGSTINVSIEVNRLSKTTFKAMTPVVETREKAQERPLFTSALFVDVQQVDANADIKGVVNFLEVRSALAMKQAYADWGIVSKVLKRNLLCLDFDLIEVPTVTASGKNGADIKIVNEVWKVMVTRPDITTIAIISGDSDYSSLIREIKRTGRGVIIFAHDGKVSPLIKNDPNLEYHALTKTGNMTGIQDNISRVKDTPSSRVGLTSQNVMAIIKNERRTVSLLPEDWMTVLDAMESRCLHGMMQFGDMTSFIVRLIKDGQVSFPAKMVVPVLNVFIHHGLFSQPARGVVMLADDFERRRKNFVNEHQLEYESEQKCWIPSENYQKGI